MPVLLNTKPTTSVNLFSPANEQNQRDRQHRRANKEIEGIDITDHDRLTSHFLADRGNTLSRFNIPCAGRPGQRKRLIEQIGRAHVRTPVTGE